MQIGLFDESKRLEKLSKLGDSLERLNKVIHWEMFRPLLEEVFVKVPKGAGGRPPYDYVIMFKVVILQRIYNLSDDQTEFQINDRMSFMRFLKLGIGDNVPDAKTIWLFKDTLVKAVVVRELFNLFSQQLEDAHLITHTGTIVDATFVDAPRQRNTRDENSKIKAGEVPEEWESPEKCYKLRQKDTDSRWAKKGNEIHYGYKDHVKADAESKLITDYSVTSANVHDSQALVGLVDKTDNVLFADSAYSGTVIKAMLPRELDIQIHEKGSRNHPLTEEQKNNNKVKSKTRVRVEHIFGFMTGSMNGITVRSVGINRATFNIGITNLVYNLCRYETLCRKNIQMG
jgi:IS5 family transposase